MPALVGYRDATPCSLFLTWICSLANVSMLSPETLAWHVCPLPKDLRQCTGLRSRSRRSLFPTPKPQPRPYNSNIYLGKESPVLCHSGRCATRPVLPSGHDFHQNHRLHHNVLCG
ncbi:hypothetical protein BKA82DRAFT_649734 [Pisolithus tinctorius]|uniref:Secreted protein n=1 Tax=Pisolithus tinctorius Marx 270 TaxID=870435 RepID=A0A0C3J079_PISTI|nr:hypothetical protein BKA82DRAFT_649734 [Pisolithus tinctorius]KIO02498.1 hypothetical protein M404DRAFT_649734 [Pisolithus tinctorius Marx 270]